MALQSTFQPIRQPLTDGNPPPWASGWGQDRFGIFVEFSVRSTDEAIVTQRMRWIPPGTFTMGSPEDEPGRFDNEGPTHEVTISSGFWLCDTPCTQGLWNAVMDDNPSNFVDELRPVEQVDWHDCQKFMQRLEDRVDGLTLALPTEAQWEYACRAGTRTATYAGEITILGANNAPVLDKIAWYGGNSGVDFDLEGGSDSSVWSEKQYDYQHAGTRKVAQKEPNRWDLYDVLGNVWEWCDDGRRTYSEATVEDPREPVDEGALRVVRGGGCDSGALHVRSASRGAIEPGIRVFYLGFRCALVQEASW